MKKLRPDEYISELGQTIGEELLTPTRLYPKVCLPLIQEFDIRGMVHITGGGFYDNIPRVLPENCSAEINTESWPKLPIFNLLREWGQVEWPEMYRTFNMGIGMILVVPEDQVQSVVKKLDGSGEKSYIIGRVIDGNKRVVLKGGVFNG